MAREFIDALPYIDFGYDEPGVRENVFALIEEESRRGENIKSHEDSLPQLKLDEFLTPIMKNEINRVQNNVAMETLSMKRYDLPTPSSLKMNDLSAWNESIRNSYSQLEHQANRITNLNLMTENYESVWKKYLDILQNEEQIATQTLNNLKHEINNVNNNRKNYQEKGGQKLKELEHRWASLTTNNFLLRTQLQNQSICDS